MHSGDGSRFRQLRECAFNDLLSGLRCAGKRCIARSFPVSLQSYCFALVIPLLATRFSKIIKKFLVASTFYAGFDRLGMANHIALDLLFLLSSVSLATNISRIMFLSQQKTCISLLYCKKLNLSKSV